MSDIPSDTYLSFILSRPLMEVWNIFLLTLARVIPTIAISPFLGGKVLPDPAKIGFGISLSFIFLPFLIVHTPSVPVDYTLLFMGLLIKEACIGALIGFLISVPYFYTQSAGGLIDMQRGAQSLQVSDPISSAQTSPIGTFLTNLLLIIFYGIGGILFYFQGMLTSFEIIPLGDFLPGSFFSYDSPIFLTFLNLTHLTMKMILQLAAPALLALLMADMFLGIANRMAPQVQITFLLYSIKAFVGIIVLMLAWRLLIKQFDIELGSWLKFVIQQIQSLKE